MRTAVGRRVLILLENCPFPQDRRMWQEAESLVAAGYRVSIICPAASGQARTERLAGIRVYRFPEPPTAEGFVGYLWEYGYSMLCMFFISLFLFWRRGFDIVHAANPPDTLVLIGGFYKLLGKRFVYDHHDLAPEMYYAVFGHKGKALVYQALLAFEKLSYRLADHVLVTNQSYRTIAQQRGHVPEERITIVRNGPDLNGIPRAAGAAEPRRQDKTIIGYAGEIGVHDGVDYLLRALHHLLHDLGRDDFSCILVGSGDAVPGLKSLAMELGLADHIVFTGWLDHDEVIQNLSATDICVAPEPSNTYNDRSTMVKVMEYMAMGKPIVAFDLPEHRVTAQEAALYVRANDEDAFARALARLMDDPDSRAALGACGRRRVETELAWSYSVPHLLHAYRTLS